MVVDIWHLILLADIAVLLWGIQQDTHLQVTFWMQIKCVHVTYDFDVEHLHFEEF